VPRGGYYDEDGYWHRDPGHDDDPYASSGGPPRRRERPPQRPPPPRQPPPIRDPYYDQYRDAHYDPYGRRVEVRRVVVGRPRFSRRPTTAELGIFSGSEVKDLVIATMVLAVAFTIVLGRDLLFADPMATFLLYFPVSLIATATAFTAHEVAHKFMAQRHGLPAEFMLNPIGILVALATAVLIGFLFALPGAVVFSGAGADRKTVGKVGAAGPATNIVLSLVFIPLIFLWPMFYIVVFINVFLAGFNMIPWGAFDGLKVWRWNPGIYIGMMAVIVGIFLFVIFGLFIPA
jgi:Zn-dependent protease